MYEVAWSDNTCSVGYTTIHGRLDKADREWLDSMADGWFTGTCHPNTIRLLEAQGKPAPYYFTFREDERGKALITALRLMGMPGRRAMNGQALARSGEMQLTPQHVEVGE